MRGRRTVFAAAAAVAALAAPAVAYKPGWEKQWGTAADDFGIAHDVVPNADNPTGVDFAVLGHSSAARALTAGSMCLGFAAGGSAACGAVDLFVQRIGGAAGEIVWANNYGSTGNDQASSIATDKGGANLFVAGASYAGEPSGSAPQSYLLKIAASDGKIIASKLIGSPESGSQLVALVKVDPSSGDVFVVGNSGSDATVTPDGKTCSAWKGGSDVFVCRLAASNLSYKWCKFVGTPADDTVALASSSLAFDQHGNAYLAGTTLGRFGHNSPGVTSSHSDAFLVKMDGNGNIAWFEQMGDPEENDGGVAVAYDPWREQAYIIGWTEGAFGDADCATCINHGGKDIFLAQYDAEAGSLGWSKMYGGEGDEVPTDVASFRERVFFTGAVNGPNMVTYWTDPDNLKPANPDGTIRMYYNSAALGGSDWLTCEVVHTVENGEYDWWVSAVALHWIRGRRAHRASISFELCRTSVPKGMPRWCSRFGSNSDDFAATIRVDQNYNISLPGTITGQMVDTLNAVTLTSFGAKDVGFELYFEYDRFVRGFDLDQESQADVLRL